MAKTVRISHSLGGGANDIKSSLDAPYREMPTLVNADWLMAHAKRDTGMVNRNGNVYPHARLKFRETSIRFTM